MRRVTPAYSQSGTTPQAIAPTRAEPIIHGPMATRDFVRSEIRDMMADLREELDAREEKEEPIENDNPADLSTPRTAES